MLPQAGSASVYGTERCSQCVHSGAGWNLVMLAVCCELDWAVCLIVNRAVYIVPGGEMVGGSSGDRALCCKGLDLPARWMHLQSGLFFRSNHNWSISGCVMCCPVCGKVHIKDPLLLIRKSGHLYL